MAKKGEAMNETAAEKGLEQTSAAPVGPVDIPMGGADPDACGKDFEPQLQAEMERLAAENKALQEENADLDKERLEWEAQADEQAKEIAALKAKNERLEMALKPPMVNQADPGVGGNFAVYQREAGSCTVRGLRIPAQKVVELTPDVQKKLDPNVLPVALYPSREAAESALAQMKRVWAKKKKDVSKSQGATGA